MAINNFKDFVEPGPPIGGSTGSGGGYTQVVWNPNTQKYEFSTQNSQSTGSGGGLPWGGGGGGVTVDSAGNIIPAAGGGGGAAGAGSGLGWQDWTKIGTSALGLAGASGGSGGGGGGFTGGQSNFFQGPASQPLLGKSFEQLMALLMREGRTDPRLLNRNVNANARATESQQQAVRGSAAMRGMQNSGVNNAIEAAVGASGADRQAGIYADDAALAEQRQRDNLKLLLDMIIKPGIDYSAIESGQFQNQQDRNDRRKSSQIGAGTDLIDSILEAFQD